MTWKEKYLLVFIGLVLLSFVFFFVSARMIKAETTKIAKIEKKLKAKQEQLNSAEVLNDELSGVRDVIINSITKSKDEKAFTADERNQFVLFLQNMADSLHIAVTSLNHDEKFSPGKIIEHQYSIGLTCTYLQLGQYFTALEKADRIIRVNTLDVNPVRSEKDDAQVNGDTHYRVTIELSAFKVKRDFGGTDEVSSSSKKAKSESSSDDSSSSSTGSSSTKE
jgi:Tfp pilus assembly protein PilO